MFRTVLPSATPLRITTASSSVTSSDSTVCSTSERKSLKISSANPCLGQECSEVFRRHLDDEHIAHIDNLVAGRGAVAPFPVNKPHDRHIFPDGLLKVSDELAHELGVLSCAHFHHVIRDVDSIRQAGLAVAWKG